LQAHRDLTDPDSTPAARLRARMELGEFDPDDST
jgi:hypothetical protein